MAKLDFKKLAKKAVKDAVKSAGKPAPAPKQTVLWNKTFKQSGSFKGYKRIKLTTYKEFGVDATLAHFAQNGYNFKGSTIRMESILVPNQFVDGDLRVVNVYVNGMRIGCVYDRYDSYRMLAENNYDKVHIRFDNGDIYLFIHLTE